MRHDQFFKDFFRTFFRDFLDLFYPDIAARLDFGSLRRKRWIQSCGFLQRSVPLKHTCRSTSRLETSLFRRSMQYDTRRFWNFRSRVLVDIQPSASSQRSSRR